eukprot:3037039-Rhodomonas_salina.4
MHIGKDSESEDLREDMTRGIQSHSLRIKAMSNPSHSQGKRPEQVTFTRMKKRQYQIRVTQIGTKVN